MHEPSFFFSSTIPICNIVYREAILVRQLYGYGKVRLMTSEKRYCTLPTYLPLCSDSSALLCSALPCLALPRSPTAIESNLPSLHFPYTSLIYINPYPPKKASQPKKEKGIMEPELEFSQQPKKFLVETDSDLLLLLLRSLLKGTEQKEIVEVVARATVA